ncbi:MAG: hypothetical protein ACAI35_02455 [Candidatus Methylacidiphilales bacterium]|nr:hypothetical protein [Candidatus Methylacidiphilales bacterium]
MTLLEIEAAISSLTAPELDELEKFIQTTREQKAEKITWPDFAARRNRIFPDGPPPGKPLSEIISEGRGEY